MTINACVRKYLLHKSAQNNKITAAFRNDKDFFMCKYNT